MELEEQQFPFMQTELLATEPIIDDDISEQIIVLT
jgi:hypothetical protein